MWKVNIPHTHLASEKSDQNWMVVNGDKINFPGGGTHFHYGADKYIAAIAKVTSYAYLNFSLFHCWQAVWLTMYLHWWKRWGTCITLTQYEAVELRCCKWSLIFFFFFFCFSFQNLVIVGHGCLLVLLLK